MLIPKLMSLNSVNFDIKECSFNDEKNNGMYCCIQVGIGNGFHSFDEYLKSNKLSMTYKPGSLIKTIQSADKNAQLKIEEKPKLIIES